MIPVVDEAVTLPSGRQVGYLARGPEGGTSVVWVHGWPGSRLEQLVVPDEVLERHDVRVIAVDRPGYGNTDPLSGTRAERMADVLRVCDLLGVDTFGAIGCSCGGANVVALAASAPDRVDRLVLASAQMPYDDMSALDDLVADDRDVLPELLLGRTDKLEVEEAQYRQTLLERGVGFLEPESFSEAEQRWLADGRVWDALDADVREAARRSYEGLMEDALMSVKPFEFDVRDVRCPVFAVHCSDDDWEPLANLRRFTDTWSNARVIVLEGMGHLGSQLYPDLLLSLATGRAG